MSELIAGGRAIDWILGLVALEAVLLIALRAFTGRGPAPLSFLGNLLSGAFLLLALRNALAGGSLLTIWLCLIGALIAHVADLFVRWETPASAARLAACRRRPCGRPFRCASPKPAFDPRPALKMKSPPMSEDLTPLLDTIDVPEDLRRLQPKQLRQLADELRQETISAVSITGGHLGAGLGVVELTVALHYVFDTPRDRLIWDVGHQAYPHKILTGRRNRIRTLRQGGGLSGFTRRVESEFDPFGAAHSSTSISAGLGMAVARDLQASDHSVVAVIGDGAMSAGMAYEAMNNAGAMDSRLVVILNDNDMSIAPPVGALSSYLSRLLSGGTYRGLREGGNRLRARCPNSSSSMRARAEELTRGFFTGGTLFEELGFYYVGPIDGHNLDHLLPVLKNVRDSKQGPILVHVVTKKGKGYGPAEAAADKLHGVNAFDVISGAQVKPKANAPAYTRVFGESLIARRAGGRKDHRRHRRDAVGHRASISSPRNSRRAASTSASPSSMR